MIIWTYSISSWKNKINIWVYKLTFWVNNKVSVAEVEKSQLWAKDSPILGKSEASVRGFV